MTALMFSAVLVTLIIIVINPKFGTFLIWPILFTYPHGWWYYHQFLPLNIGVDDLFCLFLFAAVLLRRNLIQGVPVRFSYAFWAITAFTVIAAVANIAGSTGAGAYERTVYLKEILKQGIYWSLFYAILHSIDDERDLKMQFTMFSMASVLGALIVLLQYFYPYRAEIFAAPQVLEAVDVEYGQRAGGAFMNANSAACVLGASLLLVMTATRLQQTILGKITVYSFIFILLAGVLVTRSRSGLLALGGALALMAVTGKNKRNAWLLILAALVVGMFMADIRLLYQERMRVIYDPTTGTWESNVAGRFSTWASYLETATFKDYLLGQGFIQGIVKNEMESHSIYVTLLAVYGIGGVVWGLATAIIFFKKCFAIKETHNPLIGTVARGCLWALAVWGIYGVAADAIDDQYARYVLFYLIVLLDRAYDISRQEQDWLMAQEQAEQPIGETDLAEVY